MRYGVILSIPESSTFNAPHLLGDAFKSVRWFQTEQEREHFIQGYTQQFVYYRQGDIPPFKYEKIEKDVE